MYQGDIDFSKYDNDKINQAIVRVHGEEYSDYTLNELREEKDEEAVRQVAEVIEFENHFFGSERETGRATVEELEPVPSSGASNF